MSFSAGRARSGARPLHLEPKQQLLAGATSKASVPLSNPAGSGADAHLLEAPRLLHALCLQAPGLCWQQPLLSTGCCLCSFLSQALNMLQAPLELLVSNLQPGTALLGTLWGCWGQSAGHLRCVSAFKFLVVKSQVRKLQNGRQLAGQALCSQAASGDLSTSCQQSCSGTRRLLCCMLATSRAPSVVLMQGCATSAEFLCTAAAGHASKLHVCCLHTSSSCRACRQVP